MELGNNKQFIIETKGLGKKKVQKISLNEVFLSSPMFRHHQIIDGATLTFYMTD